MRKDKTMAYGEFVKKYELDAYGSEMTYDASTGNYVPANPGAVQDDLMVEGQVNGDEYAEGLQDYARETGVNLDDLD